MDTWQLSPGTRTAKRTVEFDLELEFVDAAGRSVSSEGPFRCSMPVPYGLPSSSPSMLVQGQTVHDGRRIPLAFDLPLRGGIPTVTVRSRLGEATDIEVARSGVKRIAFGDGRTAVITEGEPRLDQRLSPPRNIEIVVCGARQLWTER